MATAHNLAEAKTGAGGLQLMAQNIMIGTVDGDIYYVRNGRVPIRPEGLRLVAADVRAGGRMRMAGLHPFEDLVQITNPPQGYMQNCNVFAVRHDEGLAAGAGEMGRASVPV